MVLTAHGAAASFDHLECYKLRDDGPNNRIEYTVDLDAADPAFGLAAGCRVRSKGREICVAVEKTNVSPTPFPAPAGPTLGTVVCYTVRCPKAARLTPEITDQLGGTRTVAVAGDSSKRRLCVPIAPTTTSTSTSIPITTTSIAVTTSTVTSTTSPLPCGNGAGNSCQGTCPSNHRCVTASNGICGCTPEPVCGCDTGPFPGPCQTPCAGNCPTGSACLQIGTFFCGCAGP